MRQKDPTFPLATAILCAAAIAADLVIITIAMAILT